MKMIKTLTLLLAAVLCLFLAACQAEMPPEESTQQTTTETTQALNIPPCAVLVRQGSFTGLEPLETDNSYGGGYLYRDRTEDGLTVITNCCFLSNQEAAESLEDYIRRTAREIGGAEPENLTWAQNDTHTQRLSYPVYLLSWQTGGAEDTQQWDGFFFLTDHYTYLYAFSTTLDNHGEMAAVWEDVFGELILFSN